MILFLIGDVHTGFDTNSEIGYETTINYFKNFIRPELNKTNLKYGAQNVIVVLLGDLFDSRSLLNVKSINVVMNFIADLSSTNQILSLVGNHDKYREFTSQCVISVYPGVTIIDQPITLEIGTQKCCFLPAIEDKLLAETHISAFPNGSYLFGHDDIEGFVYEGHGVKTEKAISFDMLSKFKKVIFGHIHKAQEYGNVIYLGSTYHTRSVEANNKNRIGILDLDTSEISYVENKISPKYITLTYQDMQQVTQDQYHMFKGNNVVIICDSKTALEVDIEKLRILLQPNTIKVSQSRTGKDISAEFDSVKATQQSILTIGQQFSQYIQSLKEITIAGKLQNITSEHVEKLQQMFHEFVGNEESK